jgi:serine/threonine protein kinase
MTLNDELIQAKQIFDRAIELPSEDREIFVEQACDSRPRLWEQVQRMLALFYESSDQVHPAVRDRSSRTERTQEAATFNGTKRFRIENKLGTGGFGTVYEVYDREWNTKLALKVLNQVRPDSLYRFKREFRSLSQLRHENLVQLYEFFVEGRSLVLYDAAGRRPELFELRSHR